MASSLAPTSWFPHSTPPFRSPADSWGPDQLIPQAPLEIRDELCSSLIARLLLGIRGWGAMQGHVFCADMGTVKGRGLVRRQSKLPGA